jgi:hypothetical protein
MGKSWPNDIVVWVVNPKGSPRLLFQGINSRRMAKPCVSGCGPLDIDKEAEILRVDSFEFGPEDTLSIDGYTGEVFCGTVRIIEPEYPRTVSDKDPFDLERYIETYMEWKRETTPHSRSGP